MWDSMSIVDDQHVRLVSALTNSDLQFSAFRQRIQCVGYQVGKDLKNFGRMGFYDDFLRKELQKP